MSLRNRQQLEKALQFIEEHLDERIGVNEVAEISCLSIFHFQRLFTDYLGETVSQYILHRRLELAAETIVKRKGVALSELARKAGFETHSAFSRAFKKHFNVSPREFRISPHTADLGRDKSRPFLRTIAPKTNSLEVEVKQLPTLWFNYKSGEIDVDEVDLENSVAYLLAEFKAYLGDGRPHLLGMATCRRDGYSDRPQSLDNILESYWYGGITTKQHEDDWSDGWVEIDAGLWAVCTHKGTYEYTYQTRNNLLHSWLPESDFELRDTIDFTRYLNSPSCVKRDKWLAELYLPIKSADPEHCAQDK